MEILLGFLAVTQTGCLVLLTRHAMLGRKTRNARPARQIPYGL